MITLAREDRQYPESVEDCDNLKCEDCIINIYNLKSVYNCIHRPILLKSEVNKKSEENSYQNDAILYMFYWDNEEDTELAYIHEKPEVVQKLLDEYRNMNESYNIDDFLMFLNNRGIKCIICVPEMMYF